MHVTGSIKFDGAATDRGNHATTSLRRLAGFNDDDVIFLAGSTQAPEEALALQVFATLKDQFPRLKLVIVPRHPHRFDEVASLLSSSGLEYVRRTQLTCTPAGCTGRIVLVDTIGELGAWWGTARIGFVGGSLGNRGGQNMIEPAAYGVATCFGPNTQNFRDVVQLLLAQEAAVVVRNGEELRRFVRCCLDDLSAAARHGERAQRLVREQLGAMVRTLALLESLDPSIATDHPARAA